MKFIKVLLLVILLAMLLCFSVSGEATINYTSEEARQIVDEYVKDEFDINLDTEYLKLESDTTYIGPNNAPSWRFIVNDIYHELPIVIIFDATNGYIAGIENHYWYPKVTFHPELAKHTVKNFLLQCDINVDINKMRLRKGFPIHNQWVFDIDNGQDSITAYVEYDTGGFTRYDINGVEILSFRELSSAVDITNDYFHDSNSDSVEVLSHYPIRDSELGYIGKIKKNFDGNNYTLIINSDIESSILVKRIFVNDKEYIVDNSVVKNEFPIYDKDYCKEVARNFAVQYLNLNPNNLKIELQRDELDLPIFNDLFDYEDSCWTYTVQDDNNEISLYISASTGKVIEIYGTEIADFSNATIEKDEAKNIAENFLKKAFPNKFKQTIYTGNESIFGKGWNIHEFTRVENNTIYTNQVLNVYLNPDGTVLHFYQSFDDIGMEIPYK